MEQRYCDFRKCGKMFQPRMARQVYCSKECRLDAKYDRMPTVVMRVPKAFHCPICKHNIHINEIKRQV